MKLKWKTGEVPIEEALFFQVDVRVKAAQGYYETTETFIGELRDGDNEMVDLETGDSFGWSYDCVSRWIPLDEVLGVIE